jgi:hypothetical protein
MDRIQEYLDFLLRWLRTEVGVMTNFQLLLLAVLLAVLCVILYTTTNPRYLEHKMARRKEREKKLEMFSRSLDQAVSRDEINLATRDKWLKEYGKAIGIPVVLNISKKPDTHKTKVLVRQRLRAMGVDIASKLALMRRKKLPKKVKPVPKSAPLPLP